MISVSGKRARTPARIHRHAPVRNGKISFITAKASFLGNLARRDSLSIRFNHDLERLEVKTIRKEIAD